MCEQDALPWAVPIRITFLLTDAIGSSNKSTHPQTWRRWRADHGQTGCYSGREVRLTGNLGPGHKAPPLCVFVLVQPEMEKRRSPLVSIPPFGRGFSRHGVFRSDGGWAAQERALAPPFIVSMSPPGYPSAWLRPRSARFRFARQIIVTPQRAAVSQHPV